MDQYLEVIDNIFTVEDCVKLIKFAENQGFQKVNDGNSQYWRTNFFNQELAYILFNELRQMGKIPDIIDDKRVVCLNTEFRISKYEPGQEFRMHKDGVNQDRYGNHSILTLNIFLNDNFEGGQINFYWRNKLLRQSIEPIPGRGTLFYTQQFHSGEKVIEGYKYLLRTDVMVKG